MSSCLHSMKSDDRLERSFIFRVGITDLKTIPEIHQLLLVKMIHTHRNEVLENRRMLGNVYCGVVIEVLPMPT